MPHGQPNHHPQKFISKQRTARRYGKNDRTIARWARDPALQFPQPVMINGRWFFAEAELDEFDRRLAADRLRDISRLRDIAFRHGVEVAVKHAQCDLAGSNRSADKKKVFCAGGET